MKSDCGRSLPAPTHSSSDMWRNHDQSYSARDSDQSFRQNHRCGNQSTTSVYSCSQSNDMKCNLPTCALRLVRTQSSSDQMRTAPMLSWNDNSCSHGQNCSVHDLDQSSRQNHRCGSQSTTSVYSCNRSNDTKCNLSTCARPSRRTRLTRDRMRTAAMPSSSDNSCSRDQSCSAHDPDSLLRQNHRYDNQSTRSVYSCNRSNDTKCNSSMHALLSRQTPLLCDRMRTAATLQSNDSLNNRGRSYSLRDSDPLPR